jgi:hypothetical protein
MQSLEKSQEAYKKSRQDQSSRDFERRQPRNRDQEGGRGYRETPRDVRHVRYGYRQSKTGPPHRQDAPDRRRNYHADRRNTQQTHELNPQIPEFQPRNTDGRQRLEQTSMQAERVTNRSNQEN